MHPSQSKISYQGTHYPMVRDTEIILVNLITSVKAFEEAGREGVR